MADSARMEGSTPRAAVYVLATGGLVIVGTIAFGLQSLAAGIDVHYPLLLVCAALALATLALTIRDVQRGDGGAAAAWACTALPVVAFLALLALPVAHLQALLVKCNPVDGPCEPVWPGFALALFLFVAGTGVNVVAIASSRRIQPREMTASEAAEEPDLQTPDALRLQAAQSLTERKRTELGTHFRAAAIYGSVAHGQAGRHSDVELILVVDDGYPYDDVYCFEEGILCECTIVPESLLLQAAQSVPTNWGIKADQYRHHLILADPQDIFPQLQEISENLAPELFTESLEKTWYICFELRGKFLNALADDDLPRVISTGWDFTYWTAMRLALRDRRPYQSSQTLWKEAGERSEPLRRLIGALTTARHAALPALVAAVWAETDTYGKPN